MLLQLRIFSLLIILLCSQNAIAETFVFVGQAGYEPFNIRTGDGQKVRYSGLDIEIIQAAADKADVEVEFRLLPWKRAIYMAEQGAVDGIFNFGWTAERERSFYYPATALRSVYFDFFVHDSFPVEVTSIDDLIDARVGLVRDYYISEELETAKYLDISHSKDTEQLFQQLMEKRVNVVIFSRISGLYTLQKQTGEIQKIRRYPYNIEDTYPSFLAFSRRAPNGLRAYKLFSKALKTLEDEGVIASIYEKYAQQLEGR